MLGTRTLGACTANFFKILGVVKRPAPTPQVPGKIGVEWPGRAFFCCQKRVYPVYFQKKLYVREKISMNGAADIGKAGEDLATQYILNLGYQILDRNYANTVGLRLGEIDIVAQNGSEIVFFEVKAAYIEAGKEARLPEWQVNRSKLRKMEKAAAIYLKEKQLRDKDYSFDVIAVTFYPDREPEIRHLDHVFLS
jgi:putative endonuclease